MTIAAPQRTEPKPVHEPFDGLARVVALALVVVLAPAARAAELIAPGIAPKLAAGAGQTVSRGASSLFYNPANLIFSKFIEPYADVSFAAVTYTYQHTDTDRFGPTTVKVNAPPVTAGLGIRLVPSFAIGGAIMPLGLGDVQTITGAPLQVQGSSYELFNIQQKQTAYKAAAGAAYRFSFPFTIGVGAIIASEKTEMLAFRVDENSLEQDENPFIDAIYATSYNQILGGVRSELFERKVVIAASYRTAATKVYKGNFLIDTGPDADYIDYDGVGYAPAAIAGGAEGRFGDFGVFAEAQMEQWSAGRAIYKRGLGKTGTTELVDALNFAGGVKYWVAKKHMITAAAGLYAANVGNGSVTDTGSQGLRVRGRLPRGDTPLSGTRASGATLQDDTADETLSGVQFGQLDAIARTVFAGGYRAKISGNGYFEGGLSYTTGTRVVPEGADGQGTYTLSVIMGSVGLAYGF